MANTRKQPASFLQQVTVFFLNTLALAFLFIARQLYISHVVNASTYAWPHLHTLTDRLVFTIRWQVLQVLVCLILLCKTGLTRFFTAAINPLSGNENLVHLDKLCLQNTFEQLILSVTSQLVLVTYLNEEEMKMIPLLVFYFVFGRITFYVGYNINPMLRTFGFSCTLWPSIYNIMYSTYCLFAYGPGLQLGMEMYRL